MFQFSLVADLCLTLCTPWAAARQASLSITNSWSLLKVMSLESMTPSNHLILCHPLSFCPQSFPASGSLPISWLFASGGQSIGVSASAPVILVNIQDWFPLGWFNLLAVQWTLTLKRVFSNTTVQKHQFSLICGPVLLHLCDYWQNHSFNYMDLCWQSNVSAF